jgi:membrane-bound transcription factor site-1 protease
MQHGGGRLALYGDSNCLDSSHQRSRCFKLLTHLLEWAGGKVRQLQTIPLRAPVQPPATVSAPLRKPPAAPVCRGQCKRLQEAEGCRPAPHALKLCAEGARPDAARGAAGGAVWRL